VKGLEGLFQAFDDAVSLCEPSRVFWGMGLEKNVMPNDKGKP
jgi:hypothetical protein